LQSYPRNEVKQRQYEASRARKKNNELHSLRCDMEYKLAIAREFSREERFYFPHNVDFRGRAYPMHPHLNHLGSDMCRGLLQFADDRPLGPNGLRWLYCQAANLWGQGVDKLPLEGRIKWIEDNLGLILDNATDPFRKPPGGGLVSNINDAATPGFSKNISRSLGGGGGSREGEDLDDNPGVDDRGHVLLQSLLSESRDQSTPYWYRAEAPFQFLATCFDIYRALASGDPPSYRSRLPVHQDGSCNGLQHYAALGRDLTGGWAVNLCPVERPQDVYTEISRMVKERVEADAAAGVPEAQTLIASTAVDRKLVKQTVMTSVYGVTFVGARAQIGSRLRERGFEDNHAMYKVSCYSARVTLDCLHEMFQSAKHIMQWLSECARLIARENRSVGWTTPMGLPVIQPYRRKSQQHVRTVLQRLVLANDQDDKPVMKQRQRTAFPPNYIHSIDSSHMMLTAIACRDAGLDFAGVHDSFWTHAGTVEQMNGVLREKFIDLHSQPLLENLLEELQQAHPDIVFPPLPPRGDLNLEDIKQAKYFFS
jgi:DNA-directed RNA polymerase